MLFESKVQSSVVEGSGSSSDERKYDLELYANQAHGIKLNM